MAPTRPFTASLAWLSIMSDGWSNVQNKPLLNFIVTTPKGNKFLYAVDTSSHVKDAAYIADRLADAIESQGPENVVAMVTDSASVNEAAADLVKLRYPTISWVRCAAHALNLALRGKIQSVDLQHLSVAYQHGSLLLHMAADEDSTCVLNFAWVLGLHVWA